jgi:hypothetical protein
MRKRGKVVQEAFLLAKPLEHRLSLSDHDNVIHGCTHLHKEEAGECDIHQDAFVYHLAKDLVNETILKVMFY